MNLKNNIRLVRKNDLNLNDFSMNFYWKEFVLNKILRKKIMRDKNLEESIKIDEDISYAYISYKSNISYASHTR